MKKFKADFEAGQLGESTVRLFTVPEVKSTASRKQRHTLTLGDVDIKVQAYITALRKAGTPVNVNSVFAAAEGVVTAVTEPCSRK